LQRLLKILGSIAAAIVLGAIGSGVWEKLLSPALSRLSDATATLISGISSTYEESIYQRAARDTTDLYPMKIAMLILFLLGIVLIVTIAYRTLSRATLQERTQRRLNFMFSIHGLSMGLALVVLAFISMARLDTASRIKEGSLRSLEILRPKIGETVYFELRSDYYSIESKADFDAFKNVVFGHASRSAKKIPLAQPPN
jgi:hypothetical protein